MKIRMTTQISGTRDGDKWPAPGDEIVVGDQEGADLCANGLAEPVAERPQPEKRDIDAGPSPKRRSKKDD